MHFNTLQTSRRLRYASGVLGMTLNCIHIFIVTGSFLYWCVMRPASQRFFMHSCIYLRILIISYLATFLGTNGLSGLMCRKAVNQSINPIFQCDMLTRQCSRSETHLLEISTFASGWCTELTVICVNMHQFQKLFHICLPFKVWLQRVWLFSWHT